MKTNNKLKGIYFIWGDELYAPFPRSFSDTFEHYLYYERYDFCDENWLVKILEECKIANKQEFDQQVSVIEMDYNKYAEQQSQKREKKAQKKMNIYYDECRKKGLVPF